MRTDVVSYPFSHFLARFQHFSSKLSLMQKEHNLKKHQEGSDYFLTQTDDGMTACMTIQGINVKLQDYILIEIQGEIIRYSVEEIDYFTEPSDMCMLALQKIESRVVGSK
jgi:hypothetical protein